MRKTILTGLTTAALVASGAMLALPAHAATTYVVALDGKATMSNCNAAASTPYTTIASAIAQASAGDTIKVCPGTYHETVSFNQQLNFVGAKAGVDARTRGTSGETIVDGGGGTAFTSTGSSAVIDGFTITGASNASDTPAVLLQGPDAVVRNNIFTDNSVAVSLEGGISTLGRNKVVGSVLGGSGFHFPNSNGSGSLISENSFSGLLDRGAVLIENDGAPIDGLFIANNDADISDGGSFVQMAGTTETSITGNHVRGSADSYNGIVLEGSNSSYTIKNNVIQDLGGDGIVLYQAAAYAPNEGGLIERNAIFGNIEGIRVESLKAGNSLTVRYNIFVANNYAVFPDEAAGLYMSSAGDVDAAFNYWGCDEGPGSGTCDQAIDDTSHGGTGTFSVTPWLVLTTSIAQPSISNGATTTFTADLNHTSEGPEILGSINDGVELASFSFDHGTVNPASVAFVNGVATTTVRGTSLGIGSVTAQVEGSTSSQPLEVTGAATLPGLTIHDNGTTEGNSGTHAVTFTVTLSKAATAKVTVHYATAGSSAVAGSDFVTKSGTLTIAMGKKQGTITVMVKGDKVKEPNETFFVNLSAPVNAKIADGSATGVIRNDDH